MTDSAHSGIDNPLFCRDDTTILPSDAKKVTEKIVKAMCGNAGALLTASAGRGECRSS